MDAVDGKRGDLGEHALNGTHETVTRVFPSVTIMCRFTGTSGAESSRFDTHP
jgi:hypothetical protein